MLMCSGYPNIRITRTHAKLFMSRPRDWTWRDSMSLQKLRPKYREYAEKILKYLVTGTGSTYRSTIQRECKIPKASMAEVLDVLKTDDLVAQKPWLHNKHVVEITQKGRRFYEDLYKVTKHFKLPYIIEKYLRNRGVNPKNLFPIQRKFIERGLISSTDNVCVFGYPGTGKTLICEMLMANEINEEGKALYCTPYKALDWQKYNDFKNWFGNGLKAKVVITDGDNPVKKGDLEKANIIIATYERVFGALRSRAPWLDEISLLCMDEITLLADEGRGETLDLLLTYFKRRDNPPRIITLSSLVGNSLEISRWLKAEPVIENLPLTSIDEHLVFRKGNTLVFLRKDGKKNEVETDLPSIDFIVKENLKKGETTLVFVGTRWKTQMLAEQLKNYLTMDAELVEVAEKFLREQEGEVTNMTRLLCELLKYGIAFHHAGVQKKARKFVESLMRENKLKIVVATTTLSHGVDYSIDNVVIDSSAGKLQISELRAYEYLNLKGRTGRYAKSKSANVYILTTENTTDELFNKYFYGSPEPVMPSSTLRKDYIGITTLLESSRAPIKIGSLINIMSETLCGASKGSNRRVVLSVIRDMTKFGFIKKKKGWIEITRIGKKVNEANISPYDARKALLLKPQASTDEILELASSIDVAKRVRESREMGFLSNDAVRILKDWINELPIDVIESKHRTSYQDQDIVDLGDYTSLSLQKIATITENVKLRKRLGILQERVKYGIKADLAKSRIMRLPALAHDKSRTLARDLNRAGYKNIQLIADANKENLCREVRICPALADRLISEAKEILEAKQK